MSIWMNKNRNFKFIYLLTNFFRIFNPLSKEMYKNIKMNAYLVMTEKL